MIEFNKEDIYIVTGASSGIGKAVALLLNKLGATVVGIGRNIERLQELQKEATTPSTMFIEQKELTEDIDGLPAYIKSLKEKYGKFKGLVCCAGIIDDKPLQMIGEEDAKRVFDVNYFVPIFLAKGFTDKRNYVKENASITFIASISAITGDKSQTIYGGSKAALIASAKTISHEVAGKIRVNCISPGVVNTPMTDRAIEMYGHYQTLDNTPLGKGEPDDIASLVAFLASSKAKWITGQNYILEGGYI